MSAPSNKSVPMNTGKKKRKRKKRDPNRPKRVSMWNRGCAQLILFTNLMYFFVLFVRQ